MVWFQGEILGVKYGMEFDTEKELIDWLVETLQVIEPLLVKVMKRLMEQE